MANTGGNPRKAKTARAKRGQLYNSEYEAGLKNKGYTIVSSNKGKGGTRTYHIEREGVGSSIIRADVPDPQKQGPKMKVVKQAPRYVNKKMTGRKFRKKLTQ